MSAKLFLTGSLPVERRRDGLQFWQFAYRTQGVGPVMSIGNVGLAEDVERICVLVARDLVVPRNASGHGLSAREQFVGVDRNGNVRIGGQAADELPKLLGVLVGFGDDVFGRTTEHQHAAYCVGQAVTL